MNFQSRVTSLDTAISRPIIEVFKADAPDSISGCFGRDEVPGPSSSREYRSLGDKGEGCSALLKCHEHLALLLKKGQVDLHSDPACQT